MTPPVETETRLLDQRQLVRLLRRRFSILALLGLLGAAGGFSFAQVVEPTYVATAQLRLAQPSAVSAGGALTGRDASREAANELAVLKSGQLIADVEESLGRSVRVSSELQDGSDIATVTSTDSSASGAVEAASAVADRYIEARGERLDSRIAEANEAIEAALARVNEQLEGATGERERALLSEQTGLRDRLTELEFARTLGASQPEVVSAPTAERSGLSRAALTIIGALAGLMIGIGLAALIERRFGKVKSAEDVDLLVPGAWTVTVKAGSQRDTTTVEPTYLAAATHISARRRPESRQVLLLAGVGRDVHIGTVSRQLAYALAACGLRVAVIDCTETPDTEVEDTHGPGLSGVLHHNVGLREAMQPVLSDRRVSLLPAGEHTADVAGLLASPAFTDLLSDLRLDHEVVLLACSPVGTASTATSAISADSALLVSSLRGARTSAVSRSVHSLQELGVGVSGVLLARRSRRSEPHTPVRPAQPELPASVNEFVARDDAVEVKR